jgi:hypothetical protein
MSVLAICQRLDCSLRRRGDALRMDGEPSNRFRCYISMILWKMWRTYGGNVEILEVS